MLRIFFGLAMVIFTAGSSVQSDKTGVMAAVNQFVDGFNKGDVKRTVAACADQTSILDEFPPHEWHGARACGKWLADYDTDAKKKGITDGFVTLETPRHIDITGDRAYVVVPANYAFKRKGKPVKETDSMLTLTLQKSVKGWLLNGWSWAKNEEH